MLHPGQLHGGDAVTYFWQAVVQSLVMTICVNCRHVQPQCIGTARSIDFAFSNNDAKIDVFTTQHVAVAGLHSIAHVDVIQHTRDWRDIGKRLENSRSGSWQPIRKQNECDKETGETDDSKSAGPFEAQQIQYLSKPKITNSVVGFTNETMVKTAGLLQ